MQLVEQKTCKILLDAEKGKISQQLPIWGKMLLNSNDFYPALQHYRNGISCINAPKVWSQERPIE